jgi:hypothetical protein
MLQGSWARTQTKSGEEVATAALARKATSSNPGFAAEGVTEISLPLKTAQALRFAEA